MSKEAYTAAVEFFISAVAQIRDDQWDAPALGVWVVRDLVGHTARSITRVEEFGANRAETVAIESAAHHYRTSLSRSGVDAQIAQSGRTAGEALGDDPLSVIRANWERARRVAEDVGIDTIIAYDNGGIRFGHYLETRVLELIVHTLDLAKAIGLETEPPREAMAVALRLIADLAVESGRGAQLALAATGRGPVPEGYSVLG